MVASGGRHLEPGVGHAAGGLGSAAVGERQPAGAQRVDQEEVVSGRLAPVDRPAEQFYGFVEPASGQLDDTGDLERHVQSKAVVGVGLFR